MSKAQDCTREQQRGPFDQFLLEILVLFILLKNKSPDSPQFPFCWDFHCMFNLSRFPSQIFWHGTDVKHIPQASSIQTQLGSSFAYDFGFIKSLLQFSQSYVEGSNDKKQHSPNMLVHSMYLFNLCLLLMALIDPFSFVTPPVILYSATCHLPSLPWTLYTSQNEIFMPFVVKN